jgi:hypothetical protein
MRGLAPKRRLALLVPAAALAALAALAPASPLTESCAGAGSNQAALVVEHGDGSVVTRCVPFDAGTVTGEALLDASGLTWSGQNFGGFGEAVCALDGEPAHYTQCLGNTDYWAVFVSRAGGAWQLSSVGISSLTLADGDAEGFRYVPVSGVPPEPPPPTGVCPAPTPTPAASAVASSGGAATAAPGPTGPGRGGGVGTGGGGNGGTGNGGAGSAPTGGAGGASTSPFWGTAGATQSEPAGVVAEAGNGSGQPAAGSSAAAGSGALAGAGLAGPGAPGPGSGGGLDAGLLVAALAGGGLGGLALLRLLAVRRRSP